MDTQAHKNAAAAAGLEWAVVLAAYREARGLEAAELDRAAAIRREAFKALDGMGHGGRFKLGHRAAFNGGDATYIDGIDVVAAGLGMSADELYAVLAADAPTLRDADTVMVETIARLAEQAGPAGDDSSEFLPLVQAAAVADVTEQWLRQLVKAGRIAGRKAGRNWLVRRVDVEFFRRHPTAGRPRREAAPF